MPQLGGQKSKTGKIISRDDHERRCGSAKIAASRGEFKFTMINYYR
jgi:hypothetical protein